MGFIPDKYVHEFVATGQPYELGVFLAVPFTGYSASGCFRAIVLAESDTDGRGVVMSGHWNGVVDLCGGRIKDWVGHEFTPVNIDGVPPMT